MTWNYWDYHSTATTTATGTTWGSPWTSASTATYYFSYRQILVETPEHWTDEDVEAFVRLINIDTKTGFTVTMVIKGDILITDPNVETRSMKNFAPLLRSCATKGDLGKINEFFNTHPLTASPVEN